MKSIPTIILILCISLTTPILDFSSAPLLVSPFLYYGSFLTLLPCLDKCDTTEIEIWGDSGQKYSPYLRFLSVSWRSEVPSNSC